MNILVLTTFVIFVVTALDADQVVEQSRSTNVQQSSFTKSEQRSFKSSSRRIRSGGLTINGAIKEYQDLRSSEKTSSSSSSSDEEANQLENRPNTIRKGYYNKFSSWSEFQKCNLNSIKSISEKCSSQFQKSYQYLNQLLLQKTDMDIELLKPEINKTLRQLPIEIKQILKTLAVIYSERFEEVSQTAIFTNKPNIQNDFQSIQNAPLDRNKSFYDQRLWIEKLDRKIQKCTNLDELIREVTNHLKTIELETIDIINNFYEGLYLLSKLTTSFLDKQLRNYPTDLNVSEIIEILTVAQELCKILSYTTDYEKIANTINEKTLKIRQEIEKLTQTENLENYLKLLNEYYFTITDNCKKNIQNQLVHKIQEFIECYKYTNLKNKLDEILQNGECTNKFNYMKKYYSTDLLNEEIRKTIQQIPDSNNINEIKKVIDFKIDETQRQIQKVIYNLNNENEIIIKYITEAIEILKKNTNYDEEQITKLINVIKIINLLKENRKIEEIIENEIRNEIQNQEIIEELLNSSDSSDSREINSIGSIPVAVYPAGVGRLQEEQVKKEVTQLVNQSTTSDTLIQSIIPDTKITTNEATKFVESIGSSKTIQNSKGEIIGDNFMKEIPNEITQNHVVRELHENKQESEYYTTNAQSSGVIIPERIIQGESESSISDNGTIENIRGDTIQKELEEVIGGNVIDNKVTETFEETQKKEYIAESQVNAVQTPLAVLQELESGSSESDTSDDVVEGTIKNIPREVIGGNVIDNKVTETFEQSQKKEYTSESQVNAVQSPLAVLQELESGSSESDTSDDVVEGTIKNIPREVIGGNVIDNKVTETFEQSQKKEYTSESQVNAVQTPLTVLQELESGSSESDTSDDEVEGTIKNIPRAIIGSNVIDNKVTKTIEESQKKEYIAESQVNAVQSPLAVLQELESGSSESDTSDDVVEGTIKNKPREVIGGSVIDNTVRETFEESQKKESVTESQINKVPIPLALPSESGSSSCECDTSEETNNYPVEHKVTPLEMTSRTEKEKKTVVLENVENFTNSGGMTKPQLVDTTYSPDKNVDTYTNSLTKQSQQKMSAKTSYGNQVASSYGPKLQKYPNNPTQMPNPCTCKPNPKLPYGKTGPPEGYNKKGTSNFTPPRTSNYLNQPTILPRTQPVHKYEPNHIIRPGDKNYLTYSSTTPDYGNSRLQPHFTPLYPGAQNLPQECGCHQPSLSHQNNRPDYIHRVGDRDNIVNSPQIYSPTPLNPGRYPSPKPYPLQEEQSMLPGYIKPQTIVPSGRNEDMHNELRILLEKRSGIIPANNEWPAQKYQNQWINVISKLSEKEAYEIVKILRTFRLLYLNIIEKIKRWQTTAVRTLEEVLEEISRSMIAEMGQLTGLLNQLSTRLIYHFYESCRCNPTLRKLQEEIRMVKSGYEQLKEIMKLLLVGFNPKRGLETIIQSSKNVKEQLDRLYEAIVLIQDNIDMKVLELMEIYATGHLSINEIHRNRNMKSYENIKRAVSIAEYIISLSSPNFINVIPQETPRDYNNGYNSKLRKGKKHRCKSRKRKSHSERKQVISSKKEEKRCGCAEDSPVVTFLY